jgi:hypothetical protein
VREIAMQTRKQDPEAIAEEAVGQRHGDPPPYAVREQPNMSQEEIARQLSKPAGPQASIPEKTAEAVGERVGDAYADPGSAGARNLPGNIARLALPHERSDAVRRVLDEPPFLIAAAGFALGYMAALLLHRRR